MVWRRDAEALTWRSVVDFELRELNSPWQDFSFFRWRRVTSFGHRDDRQWGVGRKCHLTRKPATRLPISDTREKYFVQSTTLESPSRQALLLVFRPTQHSRNDQNFDPVYGSLLASELDYTRKNNNRNNSNKTRILHSQMASTLESKRGCIVGRRLLSSVDCMNQDIRRCDY